MGGDKDHSQWWRDYSGEDWANDCDGDMDADGWKWPDRGQAGDHWSNWNDDHEEEQEPEEESAEPARPSWWGSGQHHQHEQWQADMDEEEEKWAAGSVKVPETWAQYRKAIEKRGRPYPNANVAKVRRQTKRQTEREMQYFYEKKERHLIKKHSKTCNDCGISSQPKGSSTMLVCFRQRNRSWTCRMKWRAFGG